MYDVNDIRIEHGFLVAAVHPKGATGRVLDHGRHTIRVLTVNSTRPLMVSPSTVMVVPYVKGIGFSYRSLAAIQEKAGV